MLTREQEHALESLLMNEEAPNGAPNGAGCRHSSGHACTSELSSLEGLNLVEQRAGVFVPTHEGRRVGQGILRRHRLTEVLLDTVLGLDHRRSFDIGCQMEHGMLPEMVEAFCTLLGHPTLCPHGNPIPPGPCCLARTKVVESQVVPLTDLKPGERAKVVFIRPRSHARLHRLTSLGLNPGVSIELHQRLPAFCLRFEGTEIAMERDVAEDIHVIRVESKNERGGERDEEANGR